MDGIEMKLTDHEERTLLMFGKKYTEVHAFLDQYFALFGPYHRYCLHHQKDIALVVQKFRGPVRQVAEQHIMDDLGKIPSDWSAGFGVELDFADYWVSKKTKLPRGKLIDTVRMLYPVDASTISDPKPMAGYY